MTDSHPLRSLYLELSRRHVFRVATIYVISLWPLIQIVDLLQRLFEYPDSVVRWLLYCFIAGFPIALALAWVYDLTRSGVVRTAEASVGSIAMESRPLLSRTAEAFIIGALMLLVLVLFLLKATLFGDVKDAASTAPSVPIRTTAAPPGTASVAVLPFTSFSSHEQDQVFADGLTEELLNVLSRQPQLRVAARTSSFAYRGVNRPVREVGVELGVDKILEGSVRRNDVGATIRVTAQLIDVASGTHLWSQTYDREYRDVFRIQDEIASQVADHMSVTLLGEQAGARTARANADPQSFMLVSRGRAALAKRTPSSIASAESLLQQGLQISPDWAEAHADYAEACVLMVLYAGADRAVYLARAQQAVDRALELDVGLGAAWAAQGLIHMQFDERRPQSIEALQKAIALNPSYAMAYMWLGNLQATSEAQLQYHRKALELDPRSAIAAYNVAHDLLDVGDESQAMEVFNQIVAADPFFPGAYKLVGNVNRLHGRLDDALLEYRHAYDLESDGESALMIGGLYLQLGDTRSAAEWLDKAAAHGADNLPGSFLLWLRALLARESGDDAASLALLRKIAAQRDSPVIGNLVSSLASGLLGEHAAAVERFQEAQQQAQESGWKLGDIGFLEPSLFAVYCYQQLNRASDADRVIVQARTTIDARLQSKGRADPVLWYYRAKLHLLEGDRRMALVALQRAADEGWTEAWRFSIDPIWQPLRGDETFDAIALRLETRLKTMRETLAAEEKG